MSLKIGPCGDFPGGPVREMSPSDSEGAVSVSGRGVEPHMARGGKPRGNTLANSIKTSKNGPRQKKSLNIKKNRTFLPLLFSLLLFPSLTPRMYTLGGGGGVWAILKDNHGTEYKTQLRNSGFSVLNEKHQLGNNGSQSLKAFQRVGDEKQQLADSI